jgi:AcrR family transcriptional regulator
MCSASPPPRGRGRPRDDAREQAILDAALELLLEVGYDRMSMVAVAARARASKATIYRRWAGKCELVAEAIRRRGPHHYLPEDTGSLRGDLLSAARHMVDGVTRQDAALISGVLLAMRESDELASALRCQVFEEKLKIGQCILERAVARGEAPAAASADLFHEVSSALVFNRLLLTGEPLDDAFLEHLVDDVLLPLLSRRTDART